MKWSDKYIAKLIKIEQSTRNLLIVQAAAIALPKLEKAFPNENGFTATAVQAQISLIRRYKVKSEQDISRGKTDRRTAARLSRQPFNEGRVSLDWSFEVIRKVLPVVGKYNFGDNSLSWNEIAVKVKKVDKQDWTGASLSTLFSHLYPQNHSDHDSYWGRKLEEVIDAGGPDTYTEFKRRAIAGQPVFSSSSNSPSSSSSDSDSSSSSSDSDSDSDDSDSDSSDEDEGSSAKRKNSSAGGGAKKKVKIEEE
ncbi:uncharacterized protein JCM6883_001740 [Sporobolomyces salmoneus]|uniref:uncharacterized protein n=1 Tax=Sporobolomyces salmoneus TaxID=183962 RepID=UPI00317CCDCC